MKRRDEIKSIWNIIVKREEQFVDIIKLLAPNRRWGSHLITRACMFLSMCVCVLFSVFIFIFILHNYIHIIIVNERQMEKS